MKKLNIIILTIVGLFMDIGVIVFSAIAVEDSDGFYAQRLQDEMTLFDPATESSQILALKVSRWLYILSAKLPYIEGLACVLALGAMILYLMRGAQPLSAKLYAWSFWLPLILVLPLLVAAPVSSSLTRRQGTSEFVFIGVVMLVVWVFISGLSFLGAARTIKSEAA